MFTKWTCLLATYFCLLVYHLAVDDIVKKYCTDKVSVLVH